jgi:hypothetical protein
MIKNFASIAGGFITHVSPAEDSWPLADERVECPDGFGVGDLYDGTTFSKVPPIPLTQAEIDAAALQAKNAADQAAAKADALVATVAGLTPAQVDNLIDTAFSTFTVQQRNILKGIGKVVCIQARKL